MKLEDGAILTENVAILHWLGEQFPGLAAGNDNQPLQRYRQLELLSFLSSELHKAFSPYFSGKTFSESEQAANRKKLDTKLGQFEKLLQDASPFLLGSAFSVVDAYAFVILNWTNFIGVSLDGWPLTKAYVARIGERPATRKTLVEEGLAA